MDIAAVGLDTSSGAPVVLLREQEAPHRLLPILVAPSDAAAIALPASGERAERPLTHDLLASVLDEFGARVDSAEVTELRDGTFIARLNLHDAAGTRHLDTRPSDAIALALRVDAPMLVSEAVLDEAGTLPPPELEGEVLDEESIDEAVEEFRGFLDGLDPAHFALEAPSDETAQSALEAPSDETAQSALEAPSNDRTVDLSDAADDHDGDGNSVEGPAIEDADVVDEEE